MAFPYVHFRPLVVHIREGVLARIRRHSSALFPGSVSLVKLGGHFADMMMALKLINQAAWKFSGKKIQIGELQSIESASF